jgi:hypothetical protein
VGIAAKPLAGTFDLISQTADGIKNTTTYFSDNTRERVRPPRYAMMLSTASFLIEEVSC